MQQNITRCAVLLITQNKGSHAALARDLAMLGRVDVIPLHRVGADAMPSKAIVTDIPLDSVASVQLLRKGLNRGRLPDTVLICLVPAMNHHYLTQAEALGADEVMLNSASSGLIFKRVTELSASVGSSEPNARSQRAVIQASVMLVQTMRAAEDDDIMGIDAMMSGADAVLETVERDGIGAWLDVVWNYDDATYQHSLLVVGLAAAFAIGLNFHHADRRLMTDSAVLHDIGKARIPLQILNKPGALTESERDIVKHHPLIGFNLLSKQGFTDPQILSAVRSHHEFLDGSGYPDGLSTAQIPDLVRLITICDIFAALIERRSYKKAVLPKEALAILKGMGGKLDQALVKEFGRRLAVG